MARMVGERFSVTEVVDHPSRSPLVKIMCDDTWGSSSVDTQIHTREGSDARDNEKEFRQNAITTYPDESAIDRPVGLG